MIRRIYKKVLGRLRGDKPAAPKPPPPPPRPPPEGCIGSASWTLSARDIEVLRLLIELHEAGDLLPGVGPSSICPGLEEYPLAAERPERVGYVLEQRGIQPELPRAHHHHVTRELLKPGILALNRRGLVTGYDMYHWAMYGLSSWMEDNGVQVHYKAGMRLV